MIAVSRRDVRKKVGTLDTAARNLIDATRSCKGNTPHHTTPNHAQPRLANCTSDPNHQEALRKTRRFGVEQPPSKGDIRDHTGVPPPMSIPSLTFSFNKNFKKGLKPEIIPSTFAEDLPSDSFEDVHEYAVATATHKAVEVYERLVVCFQ
jgi:hypothetical protein